MLVPLVGGAYQARSIIAGAQRSVNLYPETNPGDSQAPVPVVHYPTPGLTLLGECPTVGPVRCLYRATNGELYAVVGPVLYLVDDSFGFTEIGTINDRSTPASMWDNGLALVVVDGSSDGWAVDLSTHGFGAITGSGFYGADRVDFIDTYFVFNRPGTNQFYISLSNVDFAMLTGGTAFDALDIAAKSGSADKIASLVCVHSEIWLVGELTTEVWYNSGAADFTFQRLPGAFIEHGCIAKYSLSKQDVSTFWLSQDREGSRIVVRGSGYSVKRISTHAIEAEFSSYGVVSDAIGFCYQQQGHAFYVLTFPTANKTWAYELATGQWHELAWSDNSGNLNRHRANASTYAYGKNVVGDWQNGYIYALDPNVFTDNGRPIVRIRTFPHLVNDGDRVTYQSFIADMQVGTLEGTMVSGDFAAEPVVQLRWSDTRGASWGNPVLQSLGSAGEYLTSIQWQRLGMARDRVFELSWSAPVKTALNGAFITAKAHKS